jgi:hypothetical protein
MRALQVFSLVLLLGSWTGAGCGASGAADPVPHPNLTAGDAPVELVDESEADLVLHVSNQSFDDEEVRLTVVIDGVTVVDGDFDVADQHNWVTFPLSVPSGGHEISAESDSGATLRESFEVPHGTTRYAVIDHWTDDGSATLTWEFRRQPIHVA